jgi:recombination protein RecT
MYANSERETMPQNLAEIRNINQYLEQPQVSVRLSEKLGLEEAKQFKAALSSAVTTNAKLLECDPATIINAALIGHSLKLPPSPQLGYYYMVPYNNRRKGCKDAQFQIGYKGYIQLAMRSGYYSKLNVSTVKEGEFKGWNPLTESLDVEFISDPLEREAAKTIGYCGYFEYTNGFTKMVYWTIESMRVHADKYSKAYSLATDEQLKAGKIPSKELWKCSSFWYSDFDSMGMKTVLRQMLSKWGSMSVDMQTAYEHDLTVDSVPFSQAQLNAEEQIKDEAGSEEIEAEFEPEDQTPPETQETPEDDNSWMDED